MNYSLACVLQSLSLPAVQLSSSCYKIPTAERRGIPRFYTLTENEESKDIHLSKTIRFLPRLQTNPKEKNSVIIYPTKLQQFDGMPCEYGSKFRFVCQLSFVNNNSNEIFAILGTYAVLNGGYMATCRDLD